MRWERTGAFPSDNNRRDARPVEFLPACLVLSGAKGGAKQLRHCPPLGGAASSDWLPRPRQKRREAGPPHGHAPSPSPHSSINFYLRGGGEGLASPEIGHRRAAPLGPDGPAYVPLSALSCSRGGLGWVMVSGHRRGSSRRPAGLRVFLFPLSTHTVPPSAYVDAASTNRLRDAFAEA